MTCATGRGNIQKWRFEQQGLETPSRRGTAHDKFGASPEVVVGRVAVSAQFQHVPACFGSCAMRRQPPRARTVKVVEVDLVALRLIVVSGGPLEHERRISKAWPALHAHRARLTSNCLSLGTWWERWLRHVSPVLAFRFWDWHNEEQSDCDRQSRDPQSHGPSQT